MLEVIADLLQRFPEASVTGSAEVHVRRPVPASGILQDALFAHPGGVGKPARITYPLTLPPCTGDQRLLLVFETALSDGIPEAQRLRSDGVQFQVELAGKPLWQRTVRESRWVPGGADLTRWAGQRVGLTLVTDAGHSLDYDWALWGRPRLVRLSGREPHARVGLVALELRAPAQVIVRPRGVGNPITFEADAAGTVALPFAFPQAPGVEAVVEPPEALVPASLRIASLAPELTVSALGASVPVPIAGQRLKLRVEVRNTGQGWLPPQQERLALRVGEQELKSLSIPALAPGERHWLEWLWQAPATPAVVSLTCGGKTALLTTRGRTLKTALRQAGLKIEVYHEGWAQLWYRNRRIGVLAPLSPELELQIASDRPWLHLRGLPNNPLPALYIGDSTAHAGALVPGVEHLSAGEPSSNPRGFAPPLHERHEPPALFLTAPLAALSLGPSARPVPRNPDRYWCPDSRRTPSAPHRALVTAGVFTPVGDTLRFAASAGVLDAHMIQTQGQEATVFVTEGGPLTGLREWLRAQGGLPKPSPWPRSEPAARALCRKGFETLWNTSSRQWKPVAESPPEPNTGIATLLWWDGLVNGEASARTRAQEAVSALEPSQYAQRGPCHLMRFELPFLAGKLPEAFAALRAELEALRTSQHPDGGWRFGAKPGPQSTLGAQGDSVSGISSHAAWMLLRWARLSGDREALQAGERALRFVTRFELPRGASVWECPIYEPDVLAAVWLIAANLEGWRATGNQRWLTEALRWAESAVPFVYLWGRAERPAQLGACLATLGTTFYTHSWLGRPVQWEGLILAWHLRRLAEELESHPQRGTLQFSPADWRQLAELLLTSGLHQQRPDGTYPDSITDFQDPQPVFINPENLLALLLDFQGMPPELQTVHWRGLRISSLARLSVESGRLFAHFFPGETAHFLVSGPGVERLDGSLPVGKDCRALSRVFTQATQELVL